METHLDEVAEAQLSTEQGDWIVQKGRVALVVVSAPSEILISLLSAAANFYRCDFRLITHSESPWLYNFRNFFFFFYLSTSIKNLYTFLYEKKISMRKDS